MKTMRPETDLVILSPNNDGVPATINSENGLETSELLQKKLAIQIGDLSSEVVARSHDAADEYVREKTADTGVKGFVKKIWYGNVVRDYVRQKAINRSRDEIIKSGNIYAVSNGTYQQHEDTRVAIVKRLTSDYNLLHVGENNLDAQDITGGADLKTELNSLIVDFAKGTINYDAIETERDRLLARFGIRQKEISQNRNKGLLYVDNIIEVASNARAAYEHGVGIDAIETALSLRVADVRSGVRTVSSHELTDRLIDRVVQVPGLRLVNEATVASVAGIVMAATKYSTRRLATAMAITGTLGIGTGAIAGSKEVFRLKQERRHHSRQMAEGGEISLDNAKRRQKLEATRYATVSANQLIELLDNSMQELDTDGGLGSIVRSLGSVTEAQTRISMSDSMGADFISYDSTFSVEQQRFELDVALAKLKILLERVIDNLSDERLGELGLVRRPLQEIIDTNSQEVERLIQEDINHKDAAFKRYRNQRVLGSFVVGAVVGSGIGTLVQEATAGIESSVQGVIESNGLGYSAQTELAGLIRGHGLLIDKNTFTSFAHSNYHNGNGALDLPSGFHLISAGHGIKELVDPSGKVIVNQVGFNKNGSLNLLTVRQLHNQGYSLLTSKEIFQQSHVETSIHHSTVQVSASEYINTHPNKFTSIHRQIWYDNNTPYPDKNELATWWGGNNNSGIDSSGNFVLNVSHMTPNGSFEGTQSVNYQQLINNHQLFLAVSLSRDTQNHVMLIPINSSGNAVINAHDQALQSVFYNQDGHAQFSGGYAEVVQVTSQGPQGTNVNVLSTVVGSNQSKTITETINTPVHHVVHTNGERIITRIIKKPVIEVTPVFPIAPRSGMEDLETRLPDYSGNYYSQYLPYNTAALPYNVRREIIPTLGNETRQQRLRMLPFAPELADNPDGDVAIGVVKNRYLSSFTPSYRREISKMARSLKNQPKADNPKAVFIIPAAAHQEGKNIYRTLSSYLNQDGVTSDDFEIVVFANYPENQRRDKTVAEVRRFQREHKEINVRLVVRELSNKEAIIGHIRKLATDSVIVDLSNRGLNMGEMMLVSNDADTNYIHPQYVKTIINRAKAEPNTDAFLGFIDWDNNAYKAHPEILVGTRFMQMLEIYIRKSQNSIGSSGANFAFRPKMYMSIGGYDGNANLAEDVELGRMIKSVRSGALTRRPIAWLGRSSEINTSARRAVAKLFKDGGAPASQWNDGFGSNDKLRTTDFNLKPFDFSDQSKWSETVSAIESGLNQTLQIYQPYISTSTDDATALPYVSVSMGQLNTETVRQINRMLWVLGVDVEWEPDGSIEITNSDRMRKGLKLWQSSH